MIEPGDTITLHYALSPGAGPELESTFDTEPAQFVIGAGDLPAALEQRLVSLDAGGEAEFVISATENAFGAWDPGRRHDVERASFDPSQLLEGALVEFELPSGETVSGRIESIGTEYVCVDFNHPLAGRDIHCRLKVISVKKGAEPT